MTKRENPYTRLKRIAMSYVSKVECPKERVMFRYAVEDLNGEWDLTDLYERTAAAKQLGYEVFIETDDSHMTIRYREKRPNVPWELS